MVFRNLFDGQWKYRDPKFDRMFEFNLFHTEPDRDNNNLVYWNLNAKMVDGGQYFDPMMWENGAIEVAQQHCETAIANLNIVATTPPSMHEGFLKYSGSFPQERLQEFLTRRAMLNIGENPNE